MVSQTCQFGSVGIDATEQTTWENFLNTNGVAEAFAVGIGNGATLSTLEPIAYPNGDPNNPVVLTDQSLLADTLIGGLPGTVDGNVLTTNSGFGVDGFGADGPGAGAGIVSITVDGLRLRVRRPTMRSPWMARRFGDRNRSRSISLPRWAVT